MKQQDKTIEKEVNKMEINNLPDEEFKVMVIKITHWTCENSTETQNFNQEIKNTKEPVRTEEYRS